MGTLPVTKEHFKTLANLIEHYLNDCGVESSLFGEVSEEITVLARHYADCIRQKRIRNISNKPPRSKAATTTLPWGTQAAQRCRRHCLPRHPIQPSTAVSILHP
jgi:hypothetical protein